MPLTNEGLKVKEELSASLRDGRYLCLNGKLASPPLGAEPSASSSPHPCSAIPGAVSRSSLPTKRVFSGIMAGERGRSQVIWGGAGSSTKLPPVQDHPGEGSHPSPVPDPPCARPQCHCLCLHPILAAKTHICRRKEMAQLHRDVRSPV